MAKAEKLQGAPVEATRDLRHAIEWLKSEGDLIETDKEVDPDLEITGIQKQLDGGCPILFNNIKPALTVGSGNGLIAGEYVDGGTHLGYNRMNFRWGNVGTFQISPGSHSWQVVTKYYKANKLVPITMNFGLPPSSTLMAGAG